jgi:DNA-binding transcriptional LysR family regulator
MVRSTGPASAPKATWSVAETEFIVTVPEKLGQAMQRAENIEPLPPPIPLPSFSVKQHWHERYHADPANRWFRQAIASLFLE